MTTKDIINVYYRLRDQRKVQRERLESLIGDEAFDIDIFGIDKLWDKYRDNEEIREAISDYRSAREAFNVFGDTEW